MTVKDYVADVLCVPEIRIGYRYIVEAIELVLDTNEHKFYRKLSELSGKTTIYLEKAMRDAKKLGLEYMDADLRASLFKDLNPSVTEYINTAARDYRRTYEDKETR